MVHHNFCWSAMGIINWEVVQAISHTHLSRSLKFTGGKARCEQDLDPFTPRESENCL